MLAKRIIPCLDVTAGRVVKGINFLELKDAGDPVEIARRYDEQGADEITFLDITATSDGRDLILHIIEEVASQVFIPLTVGGGVREVADVRRLLNAGADKVSINSSAIAWAKEVCERGAGEILLTSMDRDGTKNGFDLELVRKVSDTVSIPVIASGGVGNLQDLADGIIQGHADAVLAASIFHYGEYTVQQAKQYLAQQGVVVR